MIITNKVILLGRLTRDPEVRYTTNNNTLICSFTLAVDRRVRAGDERQADFIDIVAWSKLGEFCSKYFVKGQQVAICGRLQTRNYDDKDGKKVYVTEVIAEEAYFADSKRETSTCSVANDVRVSADGFEAIEDDQNLPF